MRRVSASAIFVDLSAGYPVGSAMGMVDFGSFGTAAVVSIREPQDHLGTDVPRRVPPKPILLGARAVRWRESDIAE